MTYHSADRCPKCRAKELEKRGGDETWVCQKCGNKVPLTRMESAYMREAWNKLREMAGLEDY